MRSLEHTLPTIMTTCATPQKSLWAKICLNWPNIARTWASQTHPLKLSHTQTGVTLWIQAASKGTAFQVTHHAHGLLEALSRITGDVTVQALRVVEGPPPPTPTVTHPKPHPAPLTEQQTAWLNGHLVEKESTPTKALNEKMRQALWRLGQHIVPKP